MKIENYEDFVRLVELLPDLLEFPLVQVIMTLRSGLNRGCKCNKEKKKNTPFCCLLMLVKTTNRHTIILLLITTNEDNNILIYSS